MPLTEPSSERKASRLNIRASARQETLIREAAVVSGKSVTEFVLDSACTTAEQVLADRRQFVVDDTAWDRFMEALDRPVAAKPRLQELLETPGVLDRR
jgi:uncharacterized protein (DUF1778 family)